MAGGPIARPYAEAMIQIGEEKGVLDAFREGLDFVGAYLGEHPEFRTFFESPRIDRRVKREIIRKAFGGRLHDDVVTLIEMLVEKGRTFVLGDIVADFAGLHDEKIGRVGVLLVTAKRLEPKASEAVANRLAQILEKEIRLVEEFDPELLGGIVLQVGDTVVDGSLKKRLDTLDRQMKKTGIDGERFYED